jgi:hypothetical protein
MYVGELSMSSEKAFGFEKPKTKTNVVGFRLDDLHMAKLKALFENLDVHPRKNTITDRMILLIDRVSDLLLDYQKVKTEYHSYASKIAAAQTEKERLAKDIQVLVTQSLGKGPAPKERPRSKPKPQSKEPTPTPSIESPQRLEVPVTSLVNAVMLIPMEQGKTILEKHGLIETRTPVCAKGHQFLDEHQCDACSYHNYCNYSSANKHFKSHDAT